MSAAHTPVVQRGDIDELRELARGGRLGAQLSSPANAKQAKLDGALYSLVWPIVFNRLTRPLELRRGHRACAVRVTLLSSECVDGFHDDVEAVVDGVRRRATVPIDDLEAWIATMARTAAVDGYRRRRGLLGAPQRPRVPGWLSDRLAREPWLTRLALHVMEWVGVPTTAGHQLWPLDSWVERRAQATGDWSGSTTDTIRRDVEHVLTAMRSRPRWYQQNIEQPLGRKQTPTSVSPASIPLAPVPPSEDNDEAELAVRAICLRVDAGEDARQVATEVVRQVFHGRLSAVRLGGIVDAVVDIVG